LRSTAGSGLGGGSSGSEPSS